MTSERLSKVFEQISGSLGMPRRPEKLKGGVSGTLVFRAIINGRPVVIKIGDQVGDQEKRARNMLQRYLPFPENIDTGSDWTVNGYTQGRVLHSAVIDEHFPSDDLLTVHNDLHKRLWEDTFTSIDQRNIDGYPQKLQQTIDILFKQVVFDVRNKSFLLRSLTNQNFLINGHSIGTLDEVLAKMMSIILGNTYCSRTHGDEGLTNTIINPNNKLTIIDVGSAGIRSPYESIAKILLWLDATTTQMTGYQVAVSNDQVVINTKSEIPREALQAIALTRRQLVSWLDSKEEKKQAAAYMMVYLIRELQWLESRGKRELAPYLIARALSFAQALDGDFFPFPLTLNSDDKPIKGVIRSGPVSLNEDIGLESTVQDLDIKSEEDLIRLKENQQFTELVNTLTHGVFDMDGVLISTENEIPIQQLQQLSTFVTTSIATGASLSGVARRLKGKNLALSQLFSGSFIVNEGGQVFKNTTDITDPKKDDLLKERVIFTEEEKITRLRRFLMSNDILKEIEFIGFHPPFSEALEVPNYIKYYPSGHKKEKAEVGERTKILNELDELFIKLKISGCTKFVIKPKSEVILGQLFSMFDIQGLQALPNKGFLNIVHKGENKWTAFESNNISHGPTISFGNGLNDVVLLANSNISVIIDDGEKTAQQTYDLVRARKNSGFIIRVDPIIFKDLLKVILQIKSP